MQKKIGAILLVAGTCIGSGMIALPMVLAKLGLIPSILLMLLIWFIMYYTSLINLELNLQAGQGLSLGALGRYFSGRTAEFIGTLSLKLLSYSLLAVFIYGGSSILQELLLSKLSLEYSFSTIATWYTAIVIGILLLPITFIDHFNRLLFMGLLIVVTVLIAVLAITADWCDLPLFSDQYSKLSTWTALIPVVFTSFGFQVIFHTLTSYCNKKVNILRQAFFWGSLIPAVIYTLWICSILSVVYHNNPLFYCKMIAGEAEVGELIQVLSHITKWQSVQFLIWCISLLAIATSVIGVGIGLCDSLKRMLSKSVSNTKALSIAAALSTVLPAYLVVIYVPNAFITVLGFAGMVLAIIAILLPVYLFWKIRTQQLYYPILRKKWLIHFSVGIAILVIISELVTVL
jgi:tyrosine-specific transport protein